MDREIYTFLTENNSYIKESSVHCLLTHLFEGLSKISILTKQELAFTLNSVNVSKNVGSSVESCVIQDSNFGRLVWELPEYFVNVCLGSLLFGDDLDKQNVDLEAQQTVIQDMIFLVSESLSNLSFDDELFDLYPCKIQKGCNIGGLAYIQIFVGVNLGSLDNEEIIVSIPCESGIEISGSTIDTTVDNKLFLRYENVDILQERLDFYADAGYLFKKEYIRCFFLNCVAMSRLHGREKIVDLMIYSPSVLVTELLPFAYTKKVSLDTSVINQSLDEYVSKVDKHIRLIDSKKNQDSGFELLPTISNELLSDRIGEYIDSSHDQRSNKIQTLPDYCSYYIDNNYKFKQAIVDHESVCFKLTMLGMKHLLCQENSHSLEYEYELLFVSSS